MSGALDPVRELALEAGARGWDLHCELAGAFARAGSGEGEALWVASVSRGDFALEAQAATPVDALVKLNAEVRRWCQMPRSRPRLVYGSRL